LATGQSYALSGANATPEAVLDGANRLRPTHLHFACHGSYNWADPIRSGLVLAGKDQLLMVRDIIAKLRLDRVRTVVLSACNTGVSDIQDIPDEVIGLVAAFLMAGAPFVEATLWIVADPTTALFMRRFYEVVVVGIQTPQGQVKLAPVQANRQAVIWLKSRSVGEIDRLLATARAGKPHDIHDSTASSSSQTEEPAPSTDAATSVEKAKPDSEATVPHGVIAATHHPAASPTRSSQDMLRGGKVGGTIAPSALDNLIADRPVPPFHWVPFTAWGR
jgi:CHAT domain-containing protein